MQFMHITCENMNEMMHLQVIIVSVVFMMANQVCNESEAFVCVLTQTGFFMRQTACLVVNPIKVNSFAYLFNCTTVGRTSD